MSKWFHSINVFLFAALFLTGSIVLPHLHYSELNISMEKPADLEPILQLDLDIFLPDLKQLFPTFIHLIIRESFQVFISPLPLLLILNLISLPPPFTA